MLRRLKRLLPRYSLRTLVVFMLLVTAVLVLLRRADPWILEAEYKSGIGERTTLRVDVGRGRLEFLEWPYYRRWDGLLYAYVRPVREDWWPRHAVSGPLQRREVVELLTGKILDLRFEPHAVRVLSTPTDTRYASESPDGRRCLRYRPKHQTDAASHVVSLEDTGTGRVLSLFAIDRGPAFRMPPCAAFSEDGEWLVVASSVRTRVLRRRRPEWLWGVFYLKEFWLTALFAAALAWSVLAERHRLRGATS